MKLRPFVMLDRDGTLIVEHHYLSDPRQVELIPKVSSGLRRLSEIGLGLVVITNQSAIGRGFFSEARLDLIHRRLRELLEVEGIHLDGIYYCPHRPEDNCQCRKPQPGLVELAVQELGFDPHTSFMIGDKACDIEVGNRVGATTLLVRTGYGAQVSAENSISPDYVVDDLWSTVPIIESLLAGDKKEAGNAIR